MKNILKIASALGLALTVIPSFMEFHGIIDMKMNFTLMTVGMFLYFGTAPFWMKSKSLEESED